MHVYNYIYIAIAFAYLNTWHNNIIIIINTWTSLQPRADLPIVLFDHVTLWPSSSTLTTDPKNNSNITQLTQTHTHNITIIICTDYDYTVKLIISCYRPDEMFIDNILWSLEQVWNFQPQTLLIIMTYLLLPLIALVQYGIVDIAALMSIIFNYYVHFWQTLFINETRMYMYVFVYLF